MSAAATMAMTAISVPRSRAAPKNSSSLKKPSVSGKAASVAAATPLAAARTGIGRARPPRCEIRDSSVAAVTAPAVMNSALLATPWAST